MRKLDNIPDGGDRRLVSRRRGIHHRITTTGPRSRTHDVVMGTAFVHTMTGDHSRIARADVQDGEQAGIAICVLRTRHEPTRRPRCHRPTDAV